MRVLNRPLAFLLAAALGTAAVIVVIEVVAAALGAEPVSVPWRSWTAWAGRTHWDSTSVTLVALGLVVAGAVLLLAELMPRRSTRVPVRSHDKTTDAAVTRVGLRDAARFAATDIDGVRSAKVSTGRRRLTVSATSVATDAGVARELREPVTASVQQAIDAIGLAHAPTVRVRVAAGKH